MAPKWAIIDNVKDTLRETEPPKSVAASLGKSILREGEREREMITVRLTSVDDG